VYDGLAAHAAHFAGSLTQEQNQLQRRAGDQSHVIERRYGNGNSDSDTTHSVSLRLLGGRAGAPLRLARGTENPKNGQQMAGAKLVLTKF